MKAIILPCKLRGRILPPPLPGQAHRMLIAAALARGVSRINGLCLSDDIQATLDGLRAMGADYALEQVDNGFFTAVMTGTRRMSASLPELDCRESRATLRYLLPLSLVLRGGGIFRGGEHLTRIDLAPYVGMCKRKGVAMFCDEDDLVLRGALSPGIYRLRGDVSPQFITGLLLALPLLPGQSEITLGSSLPDKASIEHTLDILSLYGIRVEVRNSSHYIVPGHQRYMPRNSAVAGDEAMASFFYAAQGMGAELDVQGMNSRAAQPSAIIRRIAARLCDPGTAHVDVHGQHELLYAVAVQAAVRNGETTHLTGITRLRTRGQDRVAAIARELSKLGARVEEGPDTLTIHGVPSLRGGEVHAGGDPRMVVMLAVAALRASGPIAITGVGCIRRSYPDFWNEYTRLGGLVRLLPLAPENRYDAGSEPYDAHDGPTARTWPSVR